MYMSPFFFLSFFHLTIDVVSFNFHRRCMLNVLLLAFTRLRHECHDLFNPCCGMCVSTLRPWFII